MAGGRAIGRFEITVGFLGVVALAVAYGLVTGWNPLPRIGSWLDNIRTIAEPPPAWKATMPNQPRSAVVTPGGDVVVARGRVQVVSTVDGALLWSRPVDFAGVAGPPDGAVVVAGHAHGGGYDVIDPATDDVRWSEPNATGVWTFADMIVDLSCHDFSCVLNSRTPSSGALQWTAIVDGSAARLSGINPELVSVQDLASSYANALNAIPRRAPPLLGIPIDHAVQLVSSDTGNLVRTYQSTVSQRVVVAGNAVLVSTVASRRGACSFTVQARDPSSDTVLWHAGLNLRLGSDPGCDQRDDPRGGGGLIAAVTESDRDLLVRTSTGGVAFEAGDGESILATDGGLAVVRSKDRQSVRAVLMASGRTAWTHAASKAAKVAIGPNAVIITDPANGHLVAIDPVDGRLLFDVRSEATVLGFGTGGVLISLGLRIGWLPYGASTG